VLRGKTDGRWPAAWDHNGRAAGQQYEDERRGRDAANREASMKRPIHYRRADHGERFARCGRPFGRTTEHSERVTCARCLELMFAAYVAQAHRGEAVEEVSHA
jgi:hypothetical protein